MAEPKKIGERLIDAGLITRDSLDRALAAQRAQPGTKLGDVLLGLRLISEAALLRFLAAELQLRFVSADKLSKVKVGTEVLDRVPVRMAEATNLVPILFDGERKVMSVVMAEPQNVAAVEELKIVCGLTEVVVFVAARVVVQAAIKKFYYGDPTAFDVLDLSGPAGGPAAPASSGPTPPPQVTPTQSLPEARPPTNPGVRLEASLGAARQPLAPPGTIVGQPTSVRQALDAVHRGSVMSDNDFVETLNVMVGLLELRRKDAFRMHSAAVAKHSRTIAQRMGLAPREVNHITIAAYLHDLGKRPDRHLTILSARQNPEWLADARRYYKAPVKLFETVHLPIEVNNILAQLYEAHDGTGFPAAAQGERIPAGARIIATVDSYEDLTKNGQNVLGKLLEKSAAIALMEEQSGKLFDPAILDLLNQIHSGDILRQRLASEGRQALICHQDEGMRTDLRDALAKLGISAAVATSTDGIMDAVNAGEVDLLLTEVDTQPASAMDLVERLRQEPKTAGLPVIFLAPAMTPELTEKAQGVAPAEVLAQDGDPDKIAVRAGAMLDDRIAHGAPGRPVSGLLDEMSLPDLLKTLADARRSGKLTLRGQARSGEILVDHGRVVNVTSGAAKGEAAMDELMASGHGDFVLDPNYLVLDFAMDKDVDVLLREAAQRARRASTGVVSAPEKTPLTGLKKPAAAGSK